MKTIIKNYIEALGITIIIFFLTGGIEPFFKYLLDGFPESIIIMFIISIIIYFINKLDKKRYE